MLGCHQNYHGRVLTALRLVDGAGIGQAEFVQFVELVGHPPTVEIYLDFLVLGGNRPNLPDIPIIDVLVVIIPHLHDAIAGAVYAPVARDRLALGIKHVLQDGVHILGAQLKSAHGRQELDVRARVQAEPLGDALGDQFDGGADDLVGIVFIHKIKIRILVGWRHFKKQACVDPVSIMHNPAPCALPENDVQLDRGQCAGRNHVPQHVAGSHAGQLIGIPHEDQPGRGREGQQECQHQADINHGHFVQDEHVTGQRVCLVMIETACGRREF